MFRRISVALSTGLILVVAAIGIANAKVTDLPGVTVTATTSDFMEVSVPVDYMEVIRLQRDIASITDTIYVTDMSRLQVCQVLRQHPPENCTTINYPASPGIPAAGGVEWAGNGCGAGAISTAFLSIGLSFRYPGLYSGDLNKPIKGNPSIDFTISCHNHDRDYTSPKTKAMADARFERNLTSVCTSALSDGGTCLAFKDTYVSTVRERGASAYEADQRQLACSVWGDSMKKSGCA